MGNKIKRIVTKAGEANWPSLFKPDKYEKYTCDLVLEGEDALNLMEELDTALQEHVAEVKGKLPKAKRSKVKANDAPYSQELDDDDNETGRIIFKIKKKGISAKSGKVLSPPLVVDAKKNKVSSDILVYSGSKVRVSADLESYELDNGTVGVKLELVGVQIIELRSGAPTVSSLGFDEEDEGYEFEGEETKEATETEDTDEDDEEEDF